MTATVDQAALREADSILGANQERSVVRAFLKGLPPFSEQAKEHDGPDCAFCPKATSVRRKNNTTAEITKFIRPNFKQLIALVVGRNMMC